MTKVKILGSAMATAFVIGSLSATGASALPSYFHCVKVGMGAGKFTTQTNCETLTTGTGEWEFSELAAGEKLQQPGSGGTATLETVKKQVVQCSATKSTGETSAPDTSIKVIVTFEKCSGPLGTQCQSGSIKETIATHALKGTLKYIRKSPAEVGVLLQPEAEGGLDAEFKCTGILGIESVLKVRGSLICEVAPVNAMSDKGEIICNEIAGKQEITKFEKEEEVTHTLETESKGTVEFAYEQSGQTSHQVLSTTEDELRA